MLGQRVVREAVSTKLAPNSFGQVLTIDELLRRRVVNPERYSTFTRLGVVALVATGRRLNPAFEVEAAPFADLEMTCSGPNPLFDVVPSLSSFSRQAISSAISEE